MKRYWMYSENLDDFVEMTEEEFELEEKEDHSIINHSVIANYEIDDRTILGWDVSLGNASGHVMKCLHELERKIVEE